MEKNISNSVQTSKRGGRNSSSFDQENKLTYYACLRRSYDNIDFIRREAEKGVSWVYVISNMLCGVKREFEEKR